MNKIFTLIFFTFFLYSKGFNQCPPWWYEHIEMERNNLLTTYPDLYHEMVVGTSVQDRDIIAIKVSDNPNSDEPEPEILLTGAMHGDEIHPEAVMIMIAKKLCEEYNTNPDIKNLVDNHEIWIIPIFNPDGLIGHDFGHRPNANGVDLNRNFGYMWNAESFDPYPFSEPESIGVRDFILSRNFSIAIDYHAGLQGIIYPWYYKSENCPDYEEVLFLANQYDTQATYPAGAFAVTSGYDLYPTNGSFAEFLYGSLGIHAYAVELDDFPPAYTSCDVLDINFPAIQSMIEAPAKGVSGIITDINNDMPIHARIQVDDKVPFYSSNINGDFHHFLVPGTYDLTISANGYTTKVIESVVVTNDVSSPLEISLDPSTDYGASKIISSRNFNNFNDPAETWNALGINDGAHYALGDMGYVVLDFGGIIDNQAGEDLVVHGDASSTGNGFEVFISPSIDGPWTSLGLGTSTSSFDIGSVNEPRYIRIEDNGVGPDNVAGAGFNLDAVTIQGLMIATEDIDNEVPFSINLYPNPVVDKVNIAFDPKDIEAPFTILDQNGIPQLRGTLKNELDLTHLASGVFFIQVQFRNNHFTTLKFIKL